MPPANAGNTGSIPEIERSPGGGKGNPLQYSFFFFSTPVFLTGAFHGQRSLVDRSPWGHRVKHDFVSENAHTGAAW